MGPMEHPQITDRCIGRSTVDVQDVLYVVGHAKELWVKSNLFLSFTQIQFDIM